MQTCQILHRECQQVLFNENTVKLCLGQLGTTVAHPHWYPARLCYLNRNLLIDLPEQGECPEELHSGKVHKLTTVYSVRSNTGKFSESAILAMAKFPRISIDLTGQQSPSVLEKLVFWLCRVFYSTLRNKDVTIYVDEGTDQKHLQGCKILHCRSVQIIGCQPYGNLEKFITRALPVEDTHKHWRHFTKNFIYKLPTIGANEFSDHHMRTLDKLEIYAFRYNSKKYQKYEQVVVELARTWIRYWHLNEQATAKNIIRLLEENISDVRVILAETVKATSAKEKLLTTQDWRLLPLNVSEPLWRSQRFDDLSQQLDSESSELPNADGGNKFEQGSDSEEDI